MSSVFHAAVSLLSTCSTGVTATIKPGALSKTKPAINKALAEKGWVSQLKPTAHNYHLKNLQTASEAATEVSARNCVCP